MEHNCDLAKRIGKLLFDEKSSDVHLIVENVALPAHRAILSVSSDYFSALLQGNMKESSESDVVLKAVPLAGFKLLMKFIYTGQVNCENLSEDEILEVLEIAHMYGFEEFESALCRLLKEKLSIQNVCLIFNKAMFLHIEGQLKEACYSLMEEDADVILKSEAFCDLSAVALRAMLSRSTFIVEENEAFAAVTRWCAKHPDDENISNVLEAVRLPLLTTADLVTTVQDSGLFTNDRILEAIRKRECDPENLEHRAFIEPGKNVASPDLGAVLLEPHPNGDIKLLNGGAYKSTALPPRVLVNAALGSMVALKRPFLINNLSFVMEHEMHAARLKYYVEVSPNLVKWKRLFDGTGRHCAPRQELSFRSRVIRYMRIVKIEGSDPPSPFWPNTRTFVSSLNLSYSQRSTGSPLKSN